MKESPTLLVIAGPNGAGKSTYINFLIEKGEIQREEYICPDEIVKELGLNPLSREDTLKAMKEAERRRYERLKTGENIVLETVFSHPEKLDFIATGKNKFNYKTVLHFIYTTNIKINEARIQKRVSEGGHPVPTEKIGIRFKKGLKNLINAIQNSLLDEIVIIDNTDVYREVIHADFTNGHIIESSYYIHKCEGDIRRFLELLTETIKLKMVKTNKS
jgi:predicted ABC-type ATPase